MSVSFQSSEDPGKLQNCSEDPLAAQLPQEVELSREEREDLEECQRWLDWQGYIPLPAQSDSQSV